MIRLICFINLCHNGALDVHILMRTFAFVLLKSSVIGSTGSTRFYNQLYSGLNGYGVAGAWLTEALNTNLYVLYN